MAPLSLLVLLVVWVAEGELDTPTCTYHELTSIFSAPFLDTRAPHILYWDATILFLKRKHQTFYLTDTLNLFVIQMLQTFLETDIPDFFLRQTLYILFLSHEFLIN